MIYYNEIDPFAAAWLRQLMTYGHIGYGWVDERSIEDVRPGDLEGFTQHHFFAGIGVWNYALRQAGWNDDTPIWTGSCPCQPFSAAGKGGGFDDKRHLWPHFHWLIEQCNPSIVIGEQVASQDGLAWFDLVQADLEGTDYSSAAIDLCVAGVGSPNVRQRLYWLAYANHARLERQKRAFGGQHDPDGQATSRGPINGLEDAELSASARQQHIGREGVSIEETMRFTGRSVVNGLEPDTSTGLLQSIEPVDGTRSGPVNGFWRDADWLFCRDGKWRPVEPGTRPLVNGSPATMGRLRGYGNAINAVQAQTFIEAVIGVL